MCCCCSGTVAGNVKDPVCGMTVDPGEALKSEYQGEAHYFCCSGCKQKFDANPSRYAVKVQAL